MILVVPASHRPERRRPRRLYARDTIETAVERGNPLDTAVEHDRCVHRVTSRKTAYLRQQITRAVGVGERDIEDLRTDRDEEVIHSREIVPIQRRVPMQNLLQHLRARASLDLFSNR
jgi:hypothetical protein